MSPGLAEAAMARATSPAWVRLVVMSGTAPERPTATATARMATRTLRSRKVVTPTATSRMRGMKTTEA